MKALSGLEEESRTGRAALYRPDFLTAPFRAGGNISNLLGQCNRNIGCCLYVLSLDISADH